MKRLIIVGSPRTEGKSAMLAELLFEACIEECPEDEVFLAPVSTLDISGCVACDWCRRHAEGSLSPDEQVELENAEAEVVAAASKGKGSASGAAEGEKHHRHCVKRDDMDDVYPLLDDADELIVVSPVYFAGVPSQLKALLDRFQPYFWTKTRARKRPATLHVVGEGGDPHGFDPLVGSVRSACAVAGFRLERVLDWVGKITDDYEITAEADEYEISGSPIRLYAPGVVVDDVQEANEHNFDNVYDFAAAQDFAGTTQGFMDEPDFAGGSQARPAANRARLSLGENGSKRQVIKLDEEGKRVDDARRGRKRAADRKGANTKRGTSGVQQAQNKNPHVKGKGGQGRAGSQGGGQGRAGSQGGGQGKGGPQGGQNRSGKKSNKSAKNNKQGSRRG